MENELYLGLKIFHNSVHVSLTYNKDTVFFEGSKSKIPCPGGLVLQG